VEGATVDDFQAELARYVELRDQIAKLEEERKLLSERLALAMRAEGVDERAVSVEGRDVTVKRLEFVTVTYDEERLRERLGDRYAETLAIDVKKLRSKEQRVREWLGAHLGEVSSPERRRVRRLVESGQASAAEFKGAFVRKVKHAVAVKGS
jgi:hypothetical protein